MEAVSATGISISLKMAVNTKNTHESQITKDEKKLPINTSSNDKQNEGVYRFNCKICGPILKTKLSVTRHYDNRHDKKGGFVGNDFKITVNINSP
jgi:hypothetical protein